MNSYTFSFPYNGRQQRITVKSDRFKRAVKVLKSFFPHVGSQLTVRIRYKK